VSVRGIRENKNRIKVFRNIGLHMGWLQGKCLMKIKKKTLRTELARPRKQMKFMLLEPLV
jgi:hypothetical protein